MSAYTPIGSAGSVAGGNSSAASSAFSQQSQYLRVIATTNECHVKVGGNPTAAATDFWLVKDIPEVINIGAVRAQPVANLTKGATTTIEFQEGTGTQFIVGDYVTLTGTGGNNAFDFAHREVTAVNTRFNPDGGPAGYSRIITVNYDSSSVGGTWNTALEGAELRKSIKVAAIKAGGSAGTVKYQQVQISGG
tara:strand:+ start:186 stop:761 length:576 start_codon:yes stop_codon:yes gene_type:complete